MSGLVTVVGDWVGLYSNLACLSLIFSLGWFNSSSVGLSGCGLAEALGLGCILMIFGLVPVAVVMVEGGFLRLVPDFPVISGG